MSKVLIGTINYSQFTGIEENEAAFPINDYSLAAGAITTGMAIKVNTLFSHDSIPCEFSQVCLGIESNPQFFNTDGGGEAFQAHMDAPPQTKDFMHAMDWNYATPLYAYVYADVPLKDLTAGSVDVYILIEE